jgi:hypothetical protein
VRVVDPEAIQQIRLPRPPLPLSWGRPILPYRQQMADAAAAVSASSNGVAIGAAAAAAAGPEAAAAVPRGLQQQRHSLPASRNCDPASSRDLAPGKLVQLLRMVP